MNQQDRDAEAALRRQIGRQVEDAYRAAGMNQHQLAEVAGVSQNTVSRVVRGATTQPAKRKAIMDALGLRPIAEVRTVSASWPEDIEHQQAILGAYLLGKTLSERVEFAKDFAGWLVEREYLRSSRPTDE